MTISEEARRKVIAEALNAHQEGEETLRLQWMGAPKVFAVITIPTDTVLLSSHSHRIRAQLESHPERQMIKDAPFSDEAQAILEGLLRDGEGYEDLKTNLDEVGQTEPGVITRAGLLVNANRRTVALRDLREPYVRVAVLPESASQIEIDQLELRLQVARNYRMDYTFTNELLFVDELLTKHNRTPEEAAINLEWAASRETRELRKGGARVDKSTRVLRLIREVQEISGQAIPITFFDSQKIALEEIDQLYEKMRSVDPEEAGRVRDTRILGMLVGTQYRHLRFMDEDFLIDYLLSAIEETDALANHTTAFTSGAPRDTKEDVPGLDVLEDEEERDNEEPNPAYVLALLAQSSGENTVTLPSNEGEPVELDREQFVDALRTAMDSAAEDARADQLVAGKLASPIDYANKANRSIGKSLEAYKRVHSQPGFKAGKLRYAVKKLARSIDALKGAIEEEE